MIRRKIVIRVLVFVLLGAIANVAVAWWSALSIPRPLFVSLIERDEAQTQWARVAIDEWSTVEGQGGFSVRKATYSVLGIYARVAAPQPCPQDRSDPFRLLWMEETLTGWPLRSMGYQSSYMIECGIPSQVRIIDGIVLDSAPGAVRKNTRVGPLHPAWLAFAINTIFYATVLWLVFCAAPGVVRRRVRHFRGQCLQCGYDLRGQLGNSIRCPECGRT